MKKTKIKPTRSKFNILRQICNHIPQQEVSKIARETGAEDKSRTFSPWSHVVALSEAQLSHSIGLNDVCDTLQLHSGPLSTIRGATAPSRNGFSHANRERPAEMGEKLFWRTLEHLQQQSPGFGRGKRRTPAFRFKVPIHVIDSTTLELVAQCMDWAKHRRRKAAAKTHMRLNLQTLLPSFVIVDTAAEHDNKRARELCADLKSGEIALFDKAYLDFGHLKDLDERGALWVSRAKDNLAYEVIKKMPKSKDKKILRDEIIVLSNPNKLTPELMRRIAATITSMVPQGLVLMATLAFTLGAVRLARRGAIVQRLNAVEAMASIEHPRDRPGEGDPCRRRRSDNDGGRHAPSPWSPAPSWLRA